ncbi:hypothetical protein CU102_07920 [Phyllobacterium brassicacearum]|uniref:Uncharacterized protein n=1 Tax=Phyllobacterium brassicacearum TaxID=314235 RepID=A0A2P7BS80_9HYPH|nr:hypothetical protein [Phyllobacterium brassicacearum]PSH69308.1 hypothetical protein CU102_07920 [Phyllobacterium brassicacearum]TDQ34525.1 hypothetical protein DEV91_103259 [Phyllobacterium brassicacearum]
MSITTEIHHPVGLTGKETRTIFGGIQALQQAALRLADLRHGNAAFKTMDLVNVLLCQAARTRRAAMPPVRLRIRSDSRNGVRAIRLRIS